MTHSSLKKLWSSRSVSSIISDSETIDKHLRKLSVLETESVTRFIQQVIHTPVDQANKNKWDVGWGQNLSFLKQSLPIHEALTPCYFGKYPIVRIFNELYISSDFTGDLIDSISKPPYTLPQKERFEGIENTLYRDLVHYNIYCRLLDYCMLNDKKSLSVVDLGAGTCHNLYHLSSFFAKYAPNVELRLIATDWSSSTEEIVDFLCTGEHINNVSFCHFDYYKSDTWKSLLDLEPDCLYSVASLEQFPGNTNELLDLFSTSSLKQCIHLEPVKEVLNPNALLDQQSISYMTSRKYLNNFSTSLLACEMLSKGLIRSTIYRTGIGSLFIDGYTSLSWKKI